MKENPYAELLGIEVAEIKSGYARVTISTDRKHCNNLGYVHGGLIYSLADVAFELASNSYEPDAVGITTSTQFHRPAKQGDELVAEAREVHLGRRLATYQIDVRSGNTLISTFTGTVYRIPGN